VESRHEEFVQGTVSHSSQVKKWLKA
jgi:hypothetical protein